MMRTLNHLSIEDHETADHRSEFLVQDPQRILNSETFHLPVVGGVGKVNAVVVSIQLR